MAKKGKKSRKDSPPNQQKPSRLKTRRRLWIAVALVVIAAGIAAVRVFYRSGPAPPTVVVFLLDTARRDAFGCYGHPDDPTPNIDALAADGVRFDEVVSTSGWTLPAVASLMTGTWATIHGAMGRGVRLTPIRPELPMAAEVLKEAGYETVGFANAAFVSPMLGMDRGFDLFDHRYSYNWDTRKADVTVDGAIAELRKRRSKPCFYFIHLFDAHLNYGAPAAYTDRFTGGRNHPPIPLKLEDILDLQTGPERRDAPAPDDIRYVRGTYEAEVAFADANVGRFIDQMKKLGMYDRSTIVVTADHGEEFWDHGGFEHGHTLYNELVMVPLVIKPPAALRPAKRVVDSQVRLLDVMPTVFEILSLEKPPSFEGVSLVPYMAGETNEDLDALCESTLYGPMYIALRGPRYKYIQPLDADGDETGALFDWRADPAEKTDLAASLPDVAREMKTELLRWSTENAARARNMSKLKVVDLSPARIRQLRSLGYIR